MKDKQGGITTYGYDNQVNSLVKRTILELLLSNDTKPGASLDIIRTEHESRRKGISKSEFSLAMVQLLELGMIEMRNNTFHLTKAGFKAFQQDKQDGRA